MLHFVVLCILFMIFCISYISVFKLEDEKVLIACVSEQDIRNNNNCGSFSGFGILNSVFLRVLCSTNCILGNLTSY